MISLIINADDLGRSPERDRGILEAFRYGIVTSASLLANGASFVTAVSLVKKAGLPIGVHLNLADGPALTGPIAGLTDRSGTLLGKRHLRQCLAADRCDPKALGRELAAQVERVVSEGLSPDHLDSHQHCHMFPCLTGVVAELAVQFGIPAMRNSAPAETGDGSPGKGLVEELALYRRLSPTAQATIKAAGIVVPDGLWGMSSLASLGTSQLCRILEQVPEGFWELMTHPGYVWNGGGRFDGRQRQVELEALVAPEPRQVIARRGIQLRTFGDLPCAS